MSTIPHHVLAETSPVSSSTAVRGAKDREDQKAKTADAARAKRPTHLVVGLGIALAVTAVWCPVPRLGRLHPFCGRLLS